MKTIIEKIENITPHIKGECVSLVFGDQSHDIRIYADFSSGTYEVEVYDRRVDELISLNDSVFDKIINYCKELLDNHKRDVNNCYSISDRQDQERIIHR